MLYSSNFVVRFLVHTRLCIITTPVLECHHYAVRDRLFYFLIVRSSRILIIFCDKAAPGTNYENYNAANCKWGVCVFVYSVVHFLPFFLTRGFVGGSGRHRQGDGRGGVRGVRERRAYIDDDDARGIHLIT